jgi:glycosyltransferase involved in cell wall biosynthesis
MRIALVMSHADRRMDGARRELHLLRAMAEAGATVRLLRMHAGATVEQEAYLDGAVTALFCPADDSTLPHQARASAALRQAVLDFAPDLLLLKGLGYAINAQLAEALPDCAIGLIAGGLTTDPVLPRASLVLAEHEAQRRVDFAAQMAEGRCLLLPKFFDPALVGDGLGDAPPRFDIINVGGFQDARKNQAALLPLAAQRLRIVCVGGGALLEAFRATAPPRLRLVGHRRPDDVYRYLRQSRLMVHTALQEGLPRAVVEAMACGVPVVAYRSVIPAGIRHGETGLLVEPGTLVAEVLALLADAPLLAAMRESARADAHAQHGPAAIRRAAGEILALARTLRPGGSGT